MIFNILMISLSPSFIEEDKFTNIYIYTNAKEFPSESVH